MNNTYPFGANYYPLFHTEAEMAEDFRKMKEAGFNHVRTGELLCSWDRIEIHEGTYDWSWMDRLMDNAAEQKFMVMLGTGSASPPFWLYKKYPDIRIVSREGIPHPMMSTWNWACRDHPGYRKETARYIHDIVSRYHSHPALFAWQINNEPGFPFIEINNAPRIYCYNSYTAGAFREYLKKKYVTVEALNEAWKWLATNQAFTEWTEIEPPEALPKEWGNISAWLDWRRFLDYDLSEYLKWELGIIRKIDSEHPAITNTFVLTKHDYFGVSMGLDAWQFSDFVDALGFDLYPGIGKRFVHEPEYISYFLSLAKSMAKDKPLWMPEMQSGPIGGWSAGPEHNASGKDIARFAAEAVGHGAKEILFQGWREWRPQPMHWGGMVNLEGDKTPIVDAAAEIARICRSEAPFLLGAEPEHHGIGILHSKDNAIVLYGTGHDSYLQKALRGLVNLLWTESFYTDFISVKDMEENNIRKDISIIFMPFMMVVGERLAEGLKGFVKRGGVVVGTAKCGMMNDNAWYNTKRPGAGLDELFGVKETEAEVLDNIEIICEGSTGFKGYHHKVNLEVYGGTEVKAVFKDGSPAVTKKKYGRGSAWYFATHPGMAWIEYGEKSLKELIRSILADSSVERKTRLKFGKHQTGESSDKILDLHVLRNGSERMYILINGTDRDISAEITTGESLDTVKNLRDGRDINIRLKGSLNEIPVEVPAWDYAVLKARLFEK